MDKYERCITCGFPGCDRGELKDEKDIPESIRGRKLVDNLFFQAMCDRLSMRKDLILAIKEKVKREAAIRISNKRATSASKQQEVRPVLELRDGQDVYNPSCP